MLASVQEMSIREDLIATSCECLRVWM